MEIPSSTACNSAMERFSGPRRARRRGRHPRRLARRRRPRPRRRRRHPRQPRHLLPRLPSHRRPRHLGLFQKRTSVARCNSSRCGSSRRRRSCCGCTTRRGATPGRRPHPPFPRGFATRAPLAPRLYLLPRDLPPRRRRRRRRPYNCSHPQPPSCRLYPLPGCCNYRRLSIRKSPGRYIPWLRCRGHSCPCTRRECPSAPRGAAGGPALSAALRRDGRG
jgi:hypothetical protein